MSAPEGPRSRDLAPKVTAISCVALSCDRLNAGSSAVTQPLSAPPGGRVMAAGTSVVSPARPTGTRNVDAPPGPNPSTSSGLDEVGQIRGKSEHATLSRTRAPAGSTNTVGPRLMVVAFNGTPA